MKTTKIIKIGLSEVKINDFYKAKPKIEALEEIKSIEEPMKQMVEKLSNSGYAYEGSPYSGKHRGNTEICNIRFMDGNKTLFKITNKELTLRVFAEVSKALEKVSKTLEKEIDKV